MRTTKSDSVYGPKHAAFLSKCSHLVHEQKFLLGASNFLYFLNRKEDHAKSFEIHEGILISEDLIFLPVSEYPRERI